MFHALTKRNVIIMPETQNIEYKSSWHDDCLKWICGFANAQGGKIYIGRNDDGKIVGLEDDDFTIRFQEACNYSAKNVQCVQKSRNILQIQKQYKS